MQCPTCDFACFDGEACDCTQAFAIDAWVPEEGPTLPCRECGAAVTIGGPLMPLHPMTCATCEARTEVQDPLGELRKLAGELVALLGAPRCDASALVALAQDVAVEAQLLADQQGVRHA